MRYLFLIYFGKIKSPFPILIGKGLKFAIATIFPFHQTLRRSNLKIELADIE